MDKLANMKAFTLVAQTGSFADAAKRLNLATSVVSKRIKDLEAYLNAALFHRTTRSVRLTDTGYSYLDYVRKFLDDLEEVEEAIRHNTQTPIGEIKLAAPLSFGVKYLGPAIATYLETYPEVSIQTFLSDRKISLIDEGYDLAIRIGHLEDSSLISKKITDCRRVVCASPSYFKHHGRPKVPADITSHNCLKYSNTSEGKSWPFQIDGKRKLQAAPGRFTADNGDLLCEAAIEGCGIAYLPTFIAGKAIEKGALETVLEDFEETDFNIYVVYQNRRHLSSKVRTLIDCFTAHFKGGL